MEGVNKIFLDLDGVIRDWIGGVFRLFGCESIPITEWGDLEKYICNSHKISNYEFWTRLHYRFWETLEPYPYMFEVLNLLPMKKVCILTSPSLTSAGGTQAWIQQHLPYLFINKQYLIGPAKEFCACSTSLLIDDSEDHINNFIRKGGSGILFPQPWNINRHETKYRIKYLGDQLSWFL